MSPAIFGPPIAQIEPRIYDKIFDHPCKHVFVRGGFCRSSWGMIGCGSYGGARDHEFRNALIENLYRVFLRTNDKISARRTYALIDELFPVGKRPERSRLSDARSAAFLPNEPASILLHGLAIAKTTEDLDHVLKAARAGDGTISLLHDRDELVKRIHDPDRGVQRQAIEQLAALNEPQAWEAVGAILNDPVAGAQAMERIISVPYLPLFDEALQSDQRSRPSAEVDDPLAPFSDRLIDIVHLDDAEIRTLFDQQKPRVDLLCLTVIRRGKRFGLLEDVLALQNKRPSSAAIRTIQDLIAGPVRKDVWKIIKADTVMTPVAQMTGYTTGGKRMYQLQQQIVSLGSKPNPANWEKLCELHRHWLSEGGNEEIAAAVAEAMYEGDELKTLEFLRKELDFNLERLTRTKAALLALGAIADPRGLAAIEAFGEKLKPDAYPQIGYYRECLNYALHRCRGIHKWQLVKNKDSTYSISRSLPASGF